MSRSEVSQVTQDAALPTGDLKLRERFDAKWIPEPNTGCWLWTGCVDEPGYGHFSSRRVDQTSRAHRWAWMLYRGPIPKGFFIDHICRVRSCVNPDHLRVVTPRVNSLENSVSLAVVNAAKTHCKHGHAFDRANTRPDDNGNRVCRACRRDIKRRWRWRKQAIRRAEREQARRAS